MRILSINSRRGFTLIELLVVISIIGLLSSVVLAALSSARDKGSIAAGQVFENHTYNALGDVIVGQWTFDDLSTGITSTLDSSGNNQTGTLHGAASGGVVSSTVTPNNRGKSVFIDNTVSGVDDIQMGATPALSINQGTIAAWIKASVSQPGQYSGAVCIACKFSSTYRNYGLYLYNNSTTLGTKIGSNAWNGGGPALNDNKWHYVAISFSNSGTTRLYVDGKQVASFAYSAYGGLPLGDGSFYVGDDSPTGYYGYQGYIDNLIVYSNVVTAEAIQKNYAEGIADHSNLASM